MRKSISRINKKKWNELSKEIRKQFPVCEHCFNALATQVHHVGCSKFSYESLLRYDKANLLSCCGKCHFLFHKSPLVTMEWFRNHRQKDHEYILRKIKEYEVVTKNK